MRDFSELLFTIQLPRVTFYSDKVVISSTYKRKMGCKCKVMPYKICLIDKLNRVFESEANNVLQGPSATFGYDVLYIDSKKPLSKGLKIVMSILTDSGNKAVIEYLMHDTERIDLVDVSTEDMSKAEKDIFCENMLHASEQQKVVKAEAVCNFDNSSVSSSTRNIIPGLDRYLDALEKEKSFLRHEGGRKYKVTNGKLIGSSKGVYSYLFDLEAELFLSDDAPITLSIGNGLSDIPGSVLMCEDFQIIVLLEKSAGERISSAHINVEPWKLLESLQNRLSHSTRINGKIAQTLINEGSKLATKESITKVEKGQEIVKRRAQTDPILIVWGPPGTGKTHTMSEIAIDFLKEDKSVLIVSHSNVSVDGVAKKIYELLNEKKEKNMYSAGQILRYGYIRDLELSENSYISSFKYAVSKCPQLNEKLEKLQKEYVETKVTTGIASQRVVEIHREISRIRSEIRDEEQKLVSKAKVVATTISKVVIDKLFEERMFDVVMFDEVSMAYVPQIAAAATYAKEHFICVGDFMQLAPIAQSPAKDVLCEDIFTCLGINVKGTPYNHPWLVMLDEQRRMHPAIAKFANKYVYHSLLRNHESVYSSREKIVRSEPFKDNAVNYIDLTGTFCASTKNQDNSRFNILSAIISMSTAIETEKELRKAGDNSSVSVITPYAAQTRLVRALIQDYREHHETSVRCATVHQFQGSESDVIVFDAVESYPGQKVGFLMGKEMNAIKRLINVAVTRARGKLITIGNAYFWDKVITNANHTFLKLQHYSIEEGNQIKHLNGSLQEHIKTLDQEKMLKFYDSFAEANSELLADILKAKQKVVVSLPSGKLNKDFENDVFKAVVKAKVKGIRVLIKSNDFANLPEKWKEFTWGTDNAIFPLIVIDDRVLWYGVPDAELSFKTGDKSSIAAKCKVICRVKGEFTTEMVKSLCNLEFRETSGGGLSPLLEKDKSTSVMSSKDEEGIEDGKGSSGLAAYVEKNIKCGICRKPMKMTRGKSGKTILWCKDCKKTELLTPDQVNQYLYINHVTCPEHNCPIEAKVGNWGLYIRCDFGHNFDPNKL